MGDHRSRHERWRSRLPANASFLVEQMTERVVPEFTRRGFVWYPDFAGGDRLHIGANEIPLQRRSGAEWPTVQLRFHRRGRPWVAVEFAALPPVCKRITSRGLVDIPREEAVVMNAPSYFGLCRGERRNRDCEFGYLWFSLLPKRYLTGEVTKILSLLPELLARLDTGIPREWLDASGGKVAPHVAMFGSWRLTESPLRRTRP